MEVTASKDEGNKVALGKMTNYHELGGMAYAAPLWRSVDSITVTTWQW